MSQSAPGYSCQLYKKKLRSSANLNPEEMPSMGSKATRKNIFKTQSDKKRKQTMVN